MRPPIVPSYRKRSTRFCVITNMPGKVVVTPVSVTDTVDRHIVWNWLANRWQLIGHKFLRDAMPAEIEVVRVELDARREHDRLVAEAEAAAEAAAEAEAGAT